MSNHDYILFAPDQVLTDKDLNDTFSYLDQQNRWTRNKLIGIGIVCGFDIVHYTGVIKITKGCGVTSQGYLITQEDEYYTYFTPYIVPDQPTDPLFSYPNNEIPFYKPFYKDKNIFLLVTDEQYKNFDSDLQKNSFVLSSLSSTFLNDYVVVLFLEATETDLKNCDMFDCNNNGERISFNIKPLLVAKKDLPDVITPVSPASPVSSLNDRLAAAGTITNLAHEIYFKRFNVPYTNLQTSDDIINAFAKLVDDFTLTRVANAYSYTYEKYQPVLNEQTNPFINLFNQLKSLRDAILATNKLLIQYFYDFIDDLIKANYEFTVKVSDVVSACCPDENLFPLHLVLGEAANDTNAYIKDAYRQYFIYSPLFDKNYGEVSEAVFLFERMKLLSQLFAIAQQTTADAAIKITPSQYEHLWLSQRAIPYFYNINESGNELYKLWSYYKTTHGSAAYNLSYNANLYNLNDAVINPLLYDIEFYNFFRIEGHIGKNYNDVLNDLVSQVQNYNLPFDVVAIQAGGDETTVADDEPQCSFQDLNSLYNVLRSDLYCLLAKLMCYVASQTYDPPLIFISIPPILGTLKTEAVNTKFKAESNKANAASNVFASAASSVFVNENANKLSFINSSLFLNLFIYFKGTFLKQQTCFNNIAANSVGKFYAQHPPSGTYFFASFDAANLSNNFLTITDLIEEIISSLYFTSLSSLNVDTLKSKISSLQNYLLQLNNVFLQFEENQKTENLFADFEEHIDLFDEIISSCFGDEFSSLKNEYTNRVTRIKQQMLFTNYYNQHRGMEHKAGVPKGGTFVIVYNAPAPVQTTTNTQTNFAALNEAKTSLQMNISSAELTQRLKSTFSDVITRDPEFINRAISVLSPAFSAVAAQSSIADNAVIADFYLPYQCCSDCAPVTFILPRQEDTVVFDIQPNRFLFDDAHNYPFTSNATVLPADFNSTTNPGGLNLLSDNNKLNLHPAMDIQSTLNTTLTYKNKTINITIVKPDASFTINVTTQVTGEPQIVLAAKNTDATSYQWLVNEKEDVFESKADPSPVALNILQQVTDSNEFTLELIITYDINDDTSADDKKVLLTIALVKKNINKGPFELPYESDAAAADNLKIKKPGTIVKKTIKKPAVTPKKRNKKS